LPIEEKIQNEYPALADASVIGVADGQGHQVPIAFAWGVHGSDGLDAKRMLAELNKKYTTATGPLVSALAVVKVEDIPMGATGKVLKRELREKFKSFLVDPKVRGALSADIALT